MKYEIIKSLGKGAMGEVFLAHDSDLVRDVALKKLNLSQGDTLSEKQKQELIKYIFIRSKAIFIIK